MKDCLLACLRQPRPHVSCSWLSSLHWFEVKGKHLANHHKIFVPSQIKWVQPRDTNSAMNIITLHNYICLYTFLHSSTPVQYIGGSHTWSIYADINMPNKSLIVVSSNKLPFLLSWDLEGPQLNSLFRFLRISEDHIESWTCTAISEHNLNCITVV